MNALVKIIAPIVVVLASLGSLFFVSKLAKTKETQRAEIGTLTTDLAKSEQKLTTAEASIAQKNSELIAKDGQVAQANADVTTAKSEAAAAQELTAQKMKELEAVQAQVAAKDKEIEEAKTKITANEQEIAKLQETATKVAELEKLDEIKKQAAALTEENKELGRQLGDFREQNKKLLAAQEELTTTPVNVRGQVAAIQDRWGFVVLNIGGDQKVRQDAQFMVYRDSKLVCKVQIVSVGQSTSIAEVLPDFQRGYPRVGDQVLR